MLRKFVQKLNYNRSNSITKIKFKISPEAKRLAKKLFENKSEKYRQNIGDELLDELADMAKIDIVNLKISDKNQYHKKRNGRVSSKQYGYYKPGSKYIYIHNRTAVRGQILANKTFLDTLLHEWMHHYDFCKLHLNSIHTAGFYARLKDLKTKLGWLEL
ncbi:MAG: hypothetical protein A2725_01370 [Candidatus Magasanikbacteria bacterium RIFCSPHIGHO2_01_FULL_33_34]|uniref:SprT-like domain-containing protein n=1 Tax=Candidatus Magasanikbacteria bacterium RIFCSPHIGHO2_01_FULL_33_34 TaxID=1798671 RepID=A0A1F6LJE2_9BACT|nr:MAG: hypothetical protein A2725_01370 [Candidatus Magasanikbacteria bacterium RIFCSPHIGHO2_01_FULL_33_34]OGH65468.1 MAG: hypothetical protein A3B83_01125 [Candidatus Magasanikbacteria bacterium RIFCSPHIGHO2_02_FULL_33_17]OGH76178.1 MAG: hypothetical protein A3A89_01945 [Candidatus Magasanikbacteria bacterium RIFCSPLOWO2_01_FULL_33_34]OGH81008.1 MAG: hypothetical protein A3F93_04480 [Candidatus Magasanikbacteria bacterium RIFCSPLOWO2_12_FULL_34_7]